MADEASETFGGGFRNYLGSLGFILPLVGVEELVRHFVDTQHPSLPWWISVILIVVGLPLFLLPWAWKFIRRNRTAEPPPLGYLRNEDSELGGAIRDMVWRSAWAKCFASQFLATNNRRAA